MPKQRLIVQSFWPPNLTAAKASLPGVETSFLTLAQANDGGPAFAAAGGHQWVSPAWPVTPAFVADAKARGLKVVPYTLNTPAEFRASRTAGVNALITDDPVLAARTLGLSRRQLAPDALKPVARIRAPRYASDDSRRAARSDTAGGRPTAAAASPGCGSQYRRNTNAATRWRAVAAGDPGARPSTSAAGPGTPTSSACARATGWATSARSSTPAPPCRWTTAPAGCASADPGPGRSTASPTAARCAARCARAPR